MNTNLIDPSIFRAYDVRGIYPSQINEDTAYLIGRAYATLLHSENPESADKPLRVAVGSDVRLSGPALKERLVEGLLESGLDVDDLGLVSTPTFYFAVARWGYDGGLQVSASHNSKEWNGVKMTRRGAASLSGANGIEQIRDIILSDKFYSSERRGVLGLRQGALEATVEEFVVQADPSFLPPLKVVIDAANGMGALDMAALFEKIPCELIGINFEPDGSFPAHEADPMKPENRKQLEQAVVEHGADLGIAPDGDGDRYFFVDEKGQTIPQGIVFGLLAAEEIKDNPGAVIPVDVRPMRITRDIIQSAGGKVLDVPAGSSLIKEAMLREGAVFSGEPTGHFFYKTTHGTFEAPILLVLNFLRLLGDAGVPASELVAPYKKYIHSGEINMKLEDRADIQPQLEKLKNAYKDGSQSEIDGLTVEYPDYWFNIRPSNTEPLLRVSMEAVSQEVLDRELEQLLNHF